MTRQIEESFAKQGLMTSFSARLDAVRDGHVVISAPIRPDVCQQHGAAHAGFTFALGDSAAGYAALSLLGEGAEVMTVEMKINLLAPATGARLIATGEVVRRGRRIVVSKAMVEAEDDNGARRDVAMLLGTMIPVEP